jgi:hypothetical protein
MDVVIYERVVVCGDEIYERVMTIYERVVTIYERVVACGGDI